MDGWLWFYFTVDYCKGSENTKRVWMLLENMASMKEIKEEEKVEKKNQKMYIDKIK